MFIKLTLEDTLNLRNPEIIVPISSIFRAEDTLNLTTNASEQDDISLASILTYTDGKSERVKETISEILRLIEHKLEEGKSGE